MTSDFLRYELHSMTCGNGVEGCWEPATHRLQVYHRTLGAGFPAFYCKKHGEEKYEKLNAELRSSQERTKE